MSAQTGPLPKTSKGANPRLRIFTLLVKAGTTIYQGAAVGVDPGTGYAEPMNGTNNALVAFGVADNTANGDGANGLPTEVIVRSGVYPMIASGLTFADLNKPAYATSDQDISTSSNGGARPVMGTIDHVESATVAWVAIEAPSAAVSIATAAFASNIALQAREVDVVFGDLSAGNSNGASVAINIGAVLPTNAQILGALVELSTPFTGGSASAVTVDIGTTGDTDAIVDGANVLAAAVDGMASTMPFGIAPYKRFVSGGAQLKATFTPDGGHALANLTAGACHIRVLYSVLA